MEIDPDRQAGDLQTHSVSQIDLADIDVRPGRVDRCGGYRRFRHLPIVATSGVLILLSGWILGSLMVVIDGGTLNRWFEPGFWKKRVAIEEVEACEPDAAVLTRSSTM